MAWTNLEYVCRTMVWNYDESNNDDSRVYMGLDQHLYRYNVAGDYYEYCGSLKNLQDESSTPIQDLLAGDDDVNDYVIKRLWNIDDGYIYGAAWKENRNPFQTIILFKWDISGTLDTELENNIIFINLLNDIYTGERIYHEWQKHWHTDHKYGDTDYAFHYYGIGSYSEPTVPSASLLIPFKQVLNKGNTYKALTPTEGEYATVNKGLIVNQDDYVNKDIRGYDDFIELEVGDEEFSPGYYNLYGGGIYTDEIDNTQYANVSEENPHISLSYGQKGHINLDSSGNLLYTKVKETSATRGAVYSGYWDDHSNVEGYRRNPLIAPLITNHYWDGDKRKLELNTDIELKAYQDSSAQVFNGCKIWVQFEYFGDLAEDYAYIVDFVDSQTILTTDLRYLSWDNSNIVWYDTTEFIITAPQYQYNLQEYNVTDDSSGYLSSKVQLSDFSESDIYEKSNRQATSSCLYDDVWYFSFFDTNEQIEATDAWRECYIGKNVSTSDGTNIDILYTFKDIVVLDMKPANTTEFLLVYMELSKYGTSQFCKVGKLNIDGSSSDITVIDNFSNIPLEMVKYNTNKFYLAVNNGLVYDIDTSTDEVDILGHGDVFVDDEVNLASNIISISSGQMNTIDTEATRYNNLIFGVSSPTFPIHTQESKVNGKYYLWKFDNYLPDRVELADFSDMSVWEAMSHLIRFSYNYVGGFAADDEGSFFLKEKEFDDANIVLEVSDDTQDNNLHTLEKDRGLDDIYNDISLVPYRSKIEPGEFEIVKSARDTEVDTSIKADDVNINVDSKYPINLSLVCTRSGDVNTEPFNVEDCPLFKWQMQSESIEVRVLQDALTDDDYIIVHSTFRGQINPWKTDDEKQPNYVDGAVNIGDYIKAVNSDNTEEKYYKISNIRTDATYGFYRILDLETPLDFIVEEGTELEVVDSLGIDDTKETFDVDWSSEGIGQVTATSGENIFWIDTDKFISDNIYVDLGSNYSGRVKKVGAWDATRGGWKVFTVSSSGQTVPSSSGDIVKAYYSPCKDVNIDKNELSNADLLGTTSSNQMSKNIDISSANFQADKGTTVYFANFSEPWLFLNVRKGMLASGVSENDTTIELTDKIWSPRADKVYATNSNISESSLYSFFDIGKTNVSIKIEPSNAQNVNFIEGDKISITSKGLVMEKDEASKQVSKDVTSINRYGKNEYSDVKCRFLTDNQAYHYVRKIRSDFSYGRYNLSATIDYTPDLDFLEDGAMALIKVHNHPLFPAFNSIKCYIKQIIHKRGSGVTVLKLKAVDFY